MANFSSIQASAVVPINGSECSRTRTGFEELVAHRTRPPFAFAAQENGVVLSVNEKAGTMIIKYKTGEKVCVDFGEQYSNNSSNGFFVTQDVVLNGYKKGDTFKKGDILAYNRQFFQADPWDKSTVRYRLGVQAHVAILDNGGTIEDASILTQPLCDRMVFNPTHEVEIVLSTDTNIRSYVKLGNEVNSTEPLLVWDESAFDEGNEEDPELVKMLQKLNTTSKRAGHTGTVVDIKVLYKSPLSAMTNSMRNFIKYATEKKNLQAAQAAGCINEDDHLASMPLTSTTKVGTVLLEPETVIIRFYIRQTKSMSAGDKLFFDSSLKSVCSQVYPDYIEVEDGSIKVEAASSARGILARLITSPFLSGITNLCLEKLESEILDIWDSK